MNRSGFKVRKRGRIESPKHDDQKNEKVKMRKG
jgi:hypothetical protein